MRRRSACAKRRGRGRAGRAGRVDVVDQGDPRGDRPSRLKCSSHVPSPVDERQTRLALDRPPAGQERPALDSPARREAPRQALRRVVSALEIAALVARDVGDDVRRRRGDALDHELGGQVRRVAETSLLPGAHERLGCSLVGDRRPGRGEREPSAGAFAAAGDGPRGRRAAELAPGRRKPDERSSAGGAQDARSGADGDRRSRRSRAETGCPEATQRTVRPKP